MQKRNSLTLAICSLGWGIEYEARANTSDHLANVLLTGDLYRRTVSSMARVTLDKRERVSSPVQHSLICPEYTHNRA